MKNAALGTVVSACAIAWASPSPADMIDQHHIDVQVTVHSFVETVLTDSEIPWSPDMISNGPGDQAAAVPQVRARFTVVANQKYFLTVTVPHTWQPEAGDGGSSYRHVRFDGASSGTHIGGTLFLDGDVENRQNGDADITPWNGEAGHIITDEHSPGSRQWGLGLYMAPNLVGDSITGAVPGRLAQLDVYSTTAHVTIALSP
jgi:hypothetical protein